MHWQREDLRDRRLRARERTGAGSAGKVGRLQVDWRWVVDGGLDAFGRERSLQCVPRFGADHEEVVDMGVAGSGEAKGKTGKARAIPAGGPYSCLVPGFQVWPGHPQRRGL